MCTYQYYFIEIRFFDAKTEQVPFGGKARKVMMKKQTMKNKLMNEG